jgi:hypothetical protein
VRSQGQELAVIAALDDCLSLSSPLLECAAVLRLIVPVSRSAKSRLGPKRDAHTFRGPTIEWEFNVCERWAVFQPTQPPTKGGVVHHRPKSSLSSLSSAPLVFEPSLTLT